MDDCIIVIPARYQSTRLPKKPLLEIAGKTLIQRVYENASEVVKMGRADRVIVATDHPEIEAEVLRFGGEAMLTPENLRSGSDRVAYLIRKHPARVVINLQGDEPLLKGAAIAQAIAPIEEGLPMASLMKRFQTSEEVFDSGKVKVLVNRAGQAVYFSRFPIPYSRDKMDRRPFACMQHIGIYAYTQETLFHFAEMKPSAWEKGESLEQLRALEAGIPIGMQEVEVDELVGVDTEEDLKRVREIFMQVEDR